MDGLIVGVDLCDSYTKIHCYGKEKTWNIPTVICKKKDTDEWHLGEDAYAYTLVGEGIIVDKLLKMVLKDGTATLEGICYRGTDLLRIYLKKIIDILEKEYPGAPIEQMVITLEYVNSRLMDALLQCADSIKIAREKIHMISHTESFVYYVMSQKKEIWNNQVGLFDLSEEVFRYHELKVQRGLRQMVVVAEQEKLEEGFNLSILDSPSGGKLADKILCSCGERLLKKKLFSTIFLTGKGFEKQDWAGDFMKLICPRRKVYVEQGIFAKGAACKGVDYLSPKPVYPFVCICEGRLHATISMQVYHKDKENQLVLASAGDNWYEAKSSVELILDDQDYLEFVISPLDPKQRRTVKLSLEELPKRPNKTTRIKISIGFLDEKTMGIVVQDKGFGELFPASDIMIKQEVRI